MQILVTLVSDL